MKAKIKAEYGLTLLELLVVIAIIVVLWALIFAALGPVRERARQAVCFNNLKQIYHAIQMYRQDYNGSDEPGRYFEMGLPPNPIILFAAGYLPWSERSKAPEVWTCPNHIPEREGDWTSYVYTVCDDGHGFKLPNVLIFPCSAPHEYKGGQEHFTDFPERIRQRGDEYPLVIDYNHSPVPPYSLGKRRDEPPPPFYVIVLRLNGRVHGRYVTSDLNAGWLY